MEGEDGVFLRCVYFSGLLTFASLVGVFDICVGESFLWRTLGIKIGWLPMEMNLTIANTPQAGSRSSACSGAISASQKLKDAPMKS